MYQINSIWKTKALAFKDQIYVPIINNKACIKYVKHILKAFA